MRQNPWHHWLQFMKIFCQHNWLSLVPGIVGTIAVVMIWQELKHTANASHVLVGGLLIVWMLAFCMEAYRRSTHFAHQIAQVNRRLEAEIAHRHQVETSLRHSEERLQLALEAAEEGWWDWDMKTNQVSRSRQYLQLLGYEASEFPDTIDPWRNAIHPDDISFMNEQLMAHLQNDAIPYTCEYRMQHQAGNWVWISDYGKVVERDQSNQPLRMIGVFRDISDRKHAEIALRDSERKYRQLIDHLNVGFVVYSCDRRVLQCNTIAYDLLGLFVEHMAGQGGQAAGYSCLREDGTTMPVEEYPVNQVFSTLAPHINSVFGIDRQGAPPVWLLVTAFPEFDVQHQLKQVGVTLLDISQLKQAEAALRRQAEVMEHALSGISSLDAEGHYRYVNQTYAATAGYRPEEMIGMPWQQTVHPADLERLTIAYQQMLQHGKVDIEARGIRQDGSTFYKQLVMIATYDEQHQLVGHHCFMKDITERAQLEVKRQQAEAALQNAQARFAGILEIASDAIISINPEQQIILFNQGAERIFGYRTEEVLGKPLAMLMPDRFTQSHREHVSQYAQIGASARQMAQRGEVFGRRKDGTEFPAEASISKLTLNGETTFTTFLRDISDRKHKEVVLRQAMETAEAANLAKSLFLANMSHELRTPLNVILGFAQVMSHDPSLTPNQQQDLATIRRSGDHLLNLINDILDLSKIETGHSTINTTTFDLIALLHSLQTMLSERAASRGIQLHFEIAPTVPQCIRADDQKLRQILLNLLSNAIKFTAQGSVTLQVNPIAPPSPIPHLPSPIPHPFPSPPPPLSPSLLLQFQVIDTGAGIAAEELETIFAAFTQAQAGKQSATGTGLGLTISRRLVQLLGGEMSVSSTLGQGSQFRFTLPVEPCDRVDLEPDQTDRPVIGLVPGQPSRRILVVDDQPHNRLLLVRLLTLVGFEVREASNGREAIEQWQEWQPNLILMDIRMPEMDGYEAARQIRCLEANQQPAPPQPVSIIALTAQASQSDRTLALAAGCDDYISKPFQERTLLLKLREYLSLEYLYSSPNRIPKDVPDPLSLPPDRSVQVLNSDPSALSDLVRLPQAWLTALETAALCGDDHAIVELAAQFPPEFAQLAVELTELATQYHFERILQHCHLSSSC